MAPSADRSWGFKGVKTSGHTPPIYLEGKVYRKHRAYPSSVAIARQARSHAGYVVPSPRSGVADSVYRRLAITSGRLGRPELRAIAIASLHSTRPTRRIRQRFTDFTVLPTSWRSVRGLHPYQPSWGLTRSSRRRTLSGMSSGELTIRAASSTLLTGFTPGSVINEYRSA
jgi:hypothetical protein